MAIGGSVRSSPWQGADAVRFRADWDSAHAGRIASAASLLRTGAQGLRNNADQQEQASAVDGGAGGDPMAAASGAGFPIAPTLSPTSWAISSTREASSGTRPEAPCSTAAGRAPPRWWLRCCGGMAR